MNAKDLKENFIKAWGPKWTLLGLGRVFFKKQLSILLERNAEEHSKEFLKWLRKKYSSASIVVGNIDKLYDKFKTEQQ